MFWIAAYATMTEFIKQRHSGPRAGIQAIEGGGSRLHGNDTPILVQRYSTFTLAALMTFAHLTRSTLM
jgi:hypothetical protein